MGACWSYAGLVNTLVCLYRANKRRIANGSNHYVEIIPFPW